MSFKMNDKVYDVLKWIVMIALPACSLFYATLAGVWGWPYVEQITTTINAFALFLGSLIGLSTVAMNKVKNSKSVTTKKGS